MSKFLSSFFPCFDFFIKNHRALLPKLRQKKGGNEKSCFSTNFFQIFFQARTLYQAFYFNIRETHRFFFFFFRFLKLKTFPLASRGSKEDTVIDYRPGSKLKPNYGSTHVRYCTFNRVIVSVGRVPRYTDTVVHSHPRFTP